MLLLERKIRKLLFWFDNEPAGVQRITSVHKQNSRHASKVLPAEFINLGLPLAGMFKLCSAPELSLL